MRVLRDPKQAEQVEDKAISRLLTQRFIDICQDDEPYDELTHGYFVLVEPGDTVKALELETGCPIVSGYLEDSPCYGEEGFTHSFECVEEHPCCYEMVFVIDDGGFGVILLIPKQPGIDPKLLELCAAYAKEPLMA